MEAPDCVMMTHNENIKSWIHMSKADPLRLMVIMARRTATKDLSAPQTPAPEGWSHIDTEVFETTTEVIDVSSGPDAEPSTRKWRLPRTNKAWQLRLQKLRTCSDRSVQYINELSKSTLKGFVTASWSLRVTPSLTKTRFGRRRNGQMCVGTRKELQSLPSHF